MKPSQSLKMATFDPASAPIGEVPPDWLEALGLHGSRLGPIADYVGTQRRSTHVLPPAERVFAALHATPFALVQAVILGQDPYPTRTHAMGLAFSVPRDMPAPLPRSLKNIHAELRFDLGLVPPDHGSLEAWAHHGVLLLNTTLTVQEGVPGSHVRQVTLGPSSAGSAGIFVRATRTRRVQRRAMPDVVPGPVPSP
jgi:uracil-DNA glycosylase